MPEATAAEKGKRLALFVMLIIGTVLHGLSMASFYLHALAKVGAALMRVLE